GARRYGHREWWHQTRRAHPTEERKPVTQLPRRKYAHEVEPPIGTPVEAAPPERSGPSRPLSVSRRGHTGSPRGRGTWTHPIAEPVDPNRRWPVSLHRG